MTVVEEESRIVLAYYDEQNNQILLKESQTNEHNVEVVVQSLSTTVQPNLVLISANLASNGPCLNIFTNLSSVENNNPLQDSTDHSNKIPYQLK